MKIFVSGGAMPARKCTLPFNAHRIPAGNLENSAKNYQFDTDFLAAEHPSENHPLQWGGERHALRTQLRSPGHRAQQVLLFLLCLTETIVSRI